jgi:lactate permease
VFRVPPVVATAAPEAAVFTFNWLSATGTAILIAALVTGVAIRCRPADLVRTYFRTIVRTGPSLVTIAAMLALGYTARYSGQDAILGLRRLSRTPVSCTRSSGRCSAGSALR